MNQKQEELITCARKIARYQVYPVLEHGLQPLEDYTIDNMTKKGLYSKLSQEQIEFAEAVREKDVWHRYHEAADLLYYSTCIDLQMLLDRLYGTGYKSTDPDKTYQNQIERIVQAGLDPEKAELAALVKYGWWSQKPGNKDEQYELQLIKDAVLTS